MKLSLDKALSLVAISVLSALGTAHAASVYEIVNLDNADFVGPGKGTLEGTRNGYAMSVNSQNELVGLSKGRKKLDTSDVDDDGVIDVEDGIAPEEAISYSVNKAIVANNFTFTSAEDVADGAWFPMFDSINGTTSPNETDPDDATTINSVDAYFYGINDNGVKVGSMTAPEHKVDYTGSSETQEYWYIRDYELRGVAKSGDVEIPLLPPYTKYVKDETTVDVGGWSAATAVNNNGLIVGYASTDISNYGMGRVDACIEADTEATPVDVCVQNEQYPNTAGTRNIQYQMRGYVWQLNGSDATGTELPLGLTPADDSTVTYTAQALGVNNNGDVAGRSHVYRNGDTDLLAMDAAYWIKNSEGQYVYNWVPVTNVKEVTNSIAYDINDSGILVGSYRSYIGGYLRDKFFYFDTKTADSKIVVPNDFYTSLSDRSSKPKDINNSGQVVGYIEATNEKEKPRPKVGFLFDIANNEFNDVNALLTCESKGYVKGADDTWTRNKVEVLDGSGKTLSYESDIRVVEATSINEDGTIVGTAFIRKPSYQFDALGKLILENGLPLFELNGNGDPVTSYLPRMVVMQPTNGGTACTASDATDETNFERQGASSFAWLFALPLLWFRRRFR